MIISSYKKKSAFSMTFAQTAIKIISNSNRFSIMKLLLNTTKDLCVHELSESIGISQSATSHQLAYLEAYGVVKSVRIGRTKCYLPTDSMLTKKLAQVIQSLD